MSVYETKIARLNGAGSPFDDVLGKVTLLVNVASKCGLTPQYTAMQQLHTDLSAKGFSVLGVPCNQFMGQEPGSAQEIQEFCSTTYGVDFPLSEKVDVNGDARHALYASLVDEWLHTNLASSQDLHPHRVPTAQVLPTTDTLRALQWREC